jgi:hypothetical protein
VLAGGLDSLLSVTRDLVVIVLVLRSLLAVSTVHGPE